MMSMDDKGVLTGFKWVWNMKEAGSQSPKHLMFIPGVGEQECMHQVELWLFPALKAGIRGFSGNQ